MGLHTDVRIAQQVTLKPIQEIAAALGIGAEFLEAYGPFKAKVRLEILESLKNRPLGKYVVVTAITPTPLGEGKTVNSIGLSMGLNRLGKSAVVAIRQPSLGPVFGLKGGAAGGGHSQVLPMEDINLHLTGDTHAVTTAHNLLAAFIDNHGHHGNRLGIDPESITWRRVVDINDRALRRVRVDVGGANERSDGFDITVASEIMAILALATSYRDMRARLGRIIVAQTKDGRPVTAEDLRCAGSMALLLRDALKPNLLQTIEHTPAFIHAGPFGNLAHGASSVLADLIACRLSDYVVTEAGFGADLGFEKFCDIKCRASGLRPHAALVIATVRGLKVHSGLFKIVPGKPLPRELEEPNVEAVAKGGENLLHMLDIVGLAGIPAVVGINRFPKDTDVEIEAVAESARQGGAIGVEVIEAFSRGGEGAAAVARLVIRACEQPAHFRYLYDVERPIKEKIETLVRTVYGGEGADYSEAAEERVTTFSRWGLDKLPICMAKTPLSLSHDPNLKGRPRGFRFPIRGIRASAGAGFIYPLSGEVMTMPGLPSEPRGERMDIDEHGNIVGLTS